MAAMPDPHANRPAMQGGQPMAAAIANGGVTMQQRQPAALAAPRLAVQQPSPGYGFTPAQLAMLKHQIIAFRSLKVGSGA